MPWLQKEKIGGKIRTQFRYTPLCISGQFGQTELLICTEGGGSVFVRNFGKKVCINTSSSPTVIVIIIATFQSQ
jgi:hypothetical protein